LADKILVVDDEPDILEITKTILEMAKYQVVTASNGDEALQKVETETPDLILLDLVMPGKSGLETCKALKSDVKLKHIPVIIFTVLSRDVDRKLTEESGADGHFTKPFTSKSLLTEVGNHLDQVRAAKFHNQLGIEQGRLEGKKILLEFDPLTPYMRFIRDFALECLMRHENVAILTSPESPIQKTFEDEKNVKIINLTPDTMLSSILAQYPKGHLNLVYDSLTDLILSTNPQAAYKFMRNSLKLLADPRFTAIFLLNSSAHQEREVNSIRGLFSNQIVYGKQGASRVKIDPSLPPKQNRDKTPEKTLMPKQTISFLIADGLWKKFLAQTIKKHGTTNKSGTELETAISEYLEHHREDN